MSFAEPSPECNQWTEWGPCMLVGGKLTRQRRETACGITEFGDCGAEEEKQDGTVCGPWSECAMRTQTRVCVVTTNGKSIEVEETRVCDNVFPDSCKWHKHATKTHLR